MTIRISLWRYAVLLALAAAPLTSSTAAEAATTPALVYHVVNAGSGYVADVNGVTIQVFIGSESFRFTGGNTRPDFDATSVSIDLTDDVTGQQSSLFGFVPTTAVVAANLQSATLAPITVDLEEAISCCDSATVTVSDAWVAAGAQQHTEFIARFCGPPQPCFGMFHNTFTVQPATTGMTISGVVDGIDLSQVAFTSLGGGLSSGLGVELLG